MGEVFESQSIIERLFKEQKASGHIKGKLNAKIRFQYVLELKRMLVFNHCKIESEEF